jgi:Zn-dependent oligopeptidase
MAMMTLLSILLAVAVGTTILYATKSATREYEYEALRREFQERAEKENEKIMDELIDLRKKVESDSYVNKRRYDLLEQEIQLLSKNQK